MPDPLTLAAWVELAVYVALLAVTGSTLVAATRPLAPLAVRALFAPAAVYAAHVAATTAGAAPAW